MILKRLIQLIFILIALLFAMDAKAGIIIRPVHHFGLVGYWDFQEGAGVKAYDKSGKDNDGDLTSMEESDWKNGKIGRALDFDGSAEYVNLGTSADLPETGPFTLTAWIKGSNLDDDEDAVIIRWDDTDSKFAFIMGVSQVWAWCSGRNAGDNNIYSATLEQGVENNNNIWVFIACTMGNGEIYAYRYGVTDSRRVAGSYSGWGASGTGAATTIGTKWSAGAGSMYFPGLIDEVRVYNRALSESEIQRLYKLSQPKVLAPPSNGLVGYWKFDEGSGTKAGDHSGNGNNGDLTNMEASDWVDGKIGQALSFDDSAVSQYISVPDSSSLDFEGGGKFTFSLWFNTARVNGDWDMFLYKKPIDGASYWFGLYGDELTVGKISPESEVRTANQNFVTNQWYHAVVVWDSAASGQEIKWYVNGINVETDSFAPVFSSTNDPLFIANSAYSETFSGKLDEVRVYNRALETSEITALYKSGLAKINASQNQKLTDGLVGLWSFNGPDMDGDTAIDRSGQGNNGTLTGGPTRTIGKLGQALNFDGSNDYVVLENSDVYDGLSVGTIAVWVKWSVNSSWDSWFSADPVFELAMTTNGFEVWSDSPSFNAYAPVSNPTNTWHHLVYVVDNSGNKFYVDGIQASVTYSTGTAATKAFLNLAGTTKYYIGRSADGTSSEYFNGVIDEVRIYNRALSAQEIQRLYNLAH